MQLEIIDHRVSAVIFLSSFVLAVFNQDLQQMATVSLPLCQSLF